MTEPQRRRRPGRVGHVDRHDDVGGAGLGRRARGTVDPRLAGDSARRTRPATAPAAGRRRAARTRRRTRPARSAVEVVGDHHPGLLVDRPDPARRPARRPRRRRRRSTAARPGRPTPSPSQSRLVRPSVGGAANGGATPGPGGGGGGPTGAGEPGAAAGEARRRAGRDLRRAGHRVHDRKRNATGLTGRGRTAGRWRVVRTSPPGSALASGSYADGSSSDSASSGVAWTLTSNAPSARR